jgi:hypothetical protein
MPTWLTITLVITGSVAVFGLILFLVLRTVFQRVERKLKRMVHDRFAREDMVQASGVNLMGQRSRQAGGIKGRGVLVLTRDRLWFALAVPERELTIPIEAILSVSLPKSFMGRSIFRELLCVRFSGPEGDDEIAWAVREAQKWRQAIELIRTSR